MQFFESKCPLMENIYYCHANGIQGKTRNFQCVGNMLNQQPASCELDEVPSSSQVLQPEPNVFWDEIHVYPFIFNKMNETTFNDSVEFQKLKTFQFRQKKITEFLDTYPYAQQFQHSAVAIILVSITIIIAEMIGFYVVPSQFHRRSPTGLYSQCTLKHCLLLRWIVSCGLSELPYMHALFVLSRSYLSPSVLFVWLAG